MMSIERESEAAQWARERRRRADAYAAVLTYLNAAVDVVPAGDVDAEAFTRELARWAGNVRGALRRVLDETNPFVASENTALREAAASILRDAEEAGVGNWDTARMVEFYSGTLTSTRRGALAQMIDTLRGERA